MLFSDIITPYKYFYWIPLANETLSDCLLVLTGNIVQRLVLCNFIGRRPLMQAWHSLQGRPSLAGEVGLLIIVSGKMCVCVWGESRWPFGSNKMQKSIKKRWCLYCRKSLPSPSSLSAELHLNIHKGRTLTLLTFSSSLNSSVEASYACCIYYLRGKQVLPQQLQGQLRCLAWAGGGSVTSWAMQQSERQ